MDEDQRPLVEQREEGEPSVERKRDPRNRDPRTTIPRGPPATNTRRDGGNEQEGIGNFPPHFQPNFAPQFPPQFPPQYPPQFPPQGWGGFGNWFGQAPPFWPGGGFVGPYFGGQDNGKGKGNGQEDEGEGDSSSSAEEGEIDTSMDNLEKIKELARELEMDVDRVDYRSKVEIAARILELDLGGEEESGPSLVTDKDKKSPVQFPFSKILEKHFRSSWIAANGVQKMEDIESRNIITAPVQGIKLGKKIKPKFKPKVKWYKIKEGSNPGWPTDSVKIDPGFSDKGSFKTSNVDCRMVDEVMETNGQMVLMLNQLAFFHSAINELVSSLDSEITGPVKEKWSVLKDFIQVEGQSMEDLISNSTNLMITMLLEKRNLVLSKASMSNQDREALKFVTPLSRENTLFSGKVEEFYKAKKEVSSTKMNDAVTSYLKKRKFSDYGFDSSKKSTVDQSKSGNSKSGGNQRFFNKKKKSFQKQNQSFRGREDQKSYKSGQYKKEQKF